MLFVASAVAPAAQATTLTRSERTLLGAVNGVRAAHNLPPLRTDKTLVRAARDHSATLIRRDVLAHGAFSLRLIRYGARGPLFGENLAWGTGEQARAHNIVRAWMASPGHRNNLLGLRWHRIGIGSRTGTFLGYADATVVTADFAG